MDVASTLDRFNTYSGNRYIYLMDFAEQHYFQKLQRVVKKFRPDPPGRMEFVGFDGIVITPSLVRNLNHAQFCSQRTMELKHTRVEESMMPDVSHDFTASKLIEDILKQRKSKFSRIDMNAVCGGLSFGLSMQFSHARLCSLAAKCNIDYSVSSIDFSLLSEEIAIRLIQHLARYHEVLIQSYVELEACHLVHYLKDLVRLETLAYEELWVLNQPLEIAKARFALFKCIKQVLANGMKILGMKPLESI